MRVAPPPHRVVTLLGGRRPAERHHDATVRDVRDRFVAHQHRRPRERLRQPHTAHERRGAAPPEAPRLDDPAVLGGPPCPCLVAGEVVATEGVDREVRRVPAGERAPTTAELLEISGGDVPLGREHVGLRHVLGHVVEVVPAVVLLGLVTRDVEQWQTGFRQLPWRGHATTRQGCGQPSSVATVPDDESCTLPGLRTTRERRRGGGPRPGTQSGRSADPHRGRGAQLSRRPHRGQPVPDLDPAPVHARQRVRRGDHRGRERRHRLPTRRPRQSPPLSSVRSRSSPACRPAPCSAIPDGVTSAEAAAFGVVYATAYHAYPQRGGGRSRRLGRRAGRRRRCRPRVRRAGPAPRGTRARGGVVAREARGLPRRRARRR